MAGQRSHRWILTDSRAESGSPAAEGEKFLLLFSLAAASIWLAVTFLNLFSFAFIASPADSSEWELCESLINHGSTLDVCGRPGIDSPPPATQRAGAKPVLYGNIYACTYPYIYVCVHIWLHFLQLSFQPH